jgi:hypothetical protein
MTATCCAVTEGEQEGLSRVGVQVRETPPFGAIIKRVLSHLWLQGLGLVVVALIFRPDLWPAAVGVTLGATLVASLAIKFNLYRRKSFLGKIAAELNRNAESGLD